MTRCAKVFIIFLFILTSVVCVVKLSLSLWSEESSITELEIWLEEYDLLKYKNLFFDKGKFIFSYSQTYLMYIFISLSWTCPIYSLYYSRFWRYQVLRFLSRYWYFNYVNVSFCSIIV